MATKKTVRKRAAVKKEEPVASRALETFVEVEQALLRDVEKVEQEVLEVAEGRHALDRMSFWGGISLFLLAAVLFTHGGEATTYMAAGLAGTLAMMIE